MATYGNLSGDVQPGSPENEFQLQHLIDIVSEQTQNAKDKLIEIRGRNEAISIADMFDMQIEMNRLGQVSEMSTSVVSAANSSIMSMARNVK